MTRHDKVWSATHKKYVRAPYKARAKRKPKPRYESKAYLAYMEYVNARFAPVLALVISESISMHVRRSGFMRRFLADRLDTSNALPEPKPSPKYVAYLAEKKEYDPRSTYHVPDSWKTWDEENITKTLEDKQ